MTWGRMTMTALILSALSETAHAQEASPEMAVDLMLLQVDGQTRAMSLSLGSGTDVEFQDFEPGDLVGEGLISTGVIVTNGTADVEPGSEAPQSAFTSSVGMHLRAE